MKRRNYGHTLYVTNLKLIDKATNKVSYGYDEAVISLVTNKKIYIYTDAVIDPDKLREFELRYYRVEWEKEVEIDGSNN